jgi:SAM-dependent methyltransferase
MPREIEWTGERCVPWANASEVIYEHYHRYCLAANLVAGMDVLDAACGEGFGANILSKAAKSVTAIDIDPETVHHAKANYSQTALHFEIGDICQLRSLGTERFDAVVCFEAIEHVSDHAGLLSGIKSVLRPGGLLLISTPDKVKYNEDNGIANPFHVKELTSTEFELLLRRYFSHVSMLGQSVCSGSAVLDLEDGNGDDVELTPFSRSGETWSFNFAKTPTYLIAVATDGSLPKLPATWLLLDDGGELITEAWGAYARVQKDLEGKRADAERLQATVEDLEAECTSRIFNLEELEWAQSAAQSLEVERDRLRLELEQELVLSAQLYREINALKSSLAMRLWRRYRALRELLLPRGTRLRNMYDLVARAILRSR